jgi:hypothetical protein
VAGPNPLTDGSPDPFSIATARVAAQNVYTTLRAIANDPGKYADRWIWELFQNARDETQLARIRVRVVLGPDFLTFSHSGNPFSQEQLVQLIVSGSTKREVAGKVGRFGTGFISTSALSGKVSISGVRQEGGFFDFTLDRAVGDSKQLEQNMVDAWNDAKQSTPCVASVEGFTTQFKWSLETDQSRAMGARTCKDLERLLPTVLALNDEFESVELVIGGSRQVWVSPVLAPRDGTPTVTEIRSSKTEGVGAAPLESTVHIACVRNTRCDVALRIEKRGNSFVIETLDGFPRLYCFSPLIGTEDFPIPAIVNSREFRPTEDRSGIFLTSEDTPETLVNRPILDDAILGFSTLAEYVAKSGWGELQRLAEISPPEKREWADLGWLGGRVKKGLIDKILELPIVRTGPSTRSP